MNKCLLSLERITVLYVHVQITNFVNLIVNIFMVYLILSAKTRIYCSLGNIEKDSHHTNKHNKLQSFKCLECNRKFTINFGFKKTCVEFSTITGAM